MTEGILHRYRQVARLLVLCCLVVVFISSSAAQTDTDSASQSVKLSVVMRGLELTHRKNVEGMLALWEFNDKKIPSVARLRFMHSKATEQIQAALRPFGYYRAKVEADLSDLGNQWQAFYRITLGDRVMVDSDPVIALNNVVVDCKDFRYIPYDHRSIMPDIKIEDEQFNKHKDLVLEFCQAKEKADLRKGEPLDQQAYDALKQTLQTTASRLGYFDAQFTKHEIRIDMKAYTAAVNLVMDPGERYRIGEAKLAQDKRWISTDLLDRYVELQDQDYFDAGALQTLQSDLSNTEYYKQVDVKAEVQDAEDLEIPVQVDLAHIKPRVYVFGIGYGTDTGVRTRLGITGRRVNTRGHKYTLEGRLSEIDYGIAASYTVPTGDPRTDSYGVHVRLDNEETDRGESFAVSLGGNYRYRDGFWFKSYRVDFTVDEFLVTGELSDTTTTLLVPSAEWTRTFPATLEKRINAVNGNWLQLTLRGASEAILSDTSFIQPRISTKWINSFENHHRLIARGTAATTWVDDFEKLPLSLRYYTGGDSTVRGYSFQNISPRNEDNEVQGGRHLLEASLEYEVPLTGNISWAAFSDYGDAFNSSPDFRLGIGVGLRWRSPIGPVRVDVARSLDSPGEGNVHLHISLGPDL